MLKDLDRAVELVDLPDIDGGHPCVPCCAAAWRTGRCARDRCGLRSSSGARSVDGTMAPGPAPGNSRGWRAGGTHLSRRKGSPDTAGEITIKRQMQPILCIMVEFTRSEVLFSSSLGSPALSVQVEQDENRDLIEREGS